MDGTLIFAKTPRGVAEVAARGPQLSMTSRRVLIMMDGRRTVDELSQIVRPGEIDGIIAQLESAGLIVRVNAGAPLDVPTVNGRESDAELPAASGAVIDDRDKDAFYDIGEGQANVTLRFVRQSDGATYTTTTWSSGGFQVVAPAGTYKVTASGG